MLFPAQVEFGDFIRHQQRHNRIHARLPPRAHLILKPVPSTRTSGNSQSPFPRAVYPVELGSHGCDKLRGLVVFGKDFARQFVNLDAPPAKQPQPMMTVNHRSVGPRLSDPGMPGSKELMSCWVVSLLY